MKTKAYGNKSPLLKSNYRAVSPMAKHFQSYARSPGFLELPQYHFLPDLPLLLPGKKKPADGTQQNDRDKILRVCNWCRAKSSSWPQERGEVTELKKAIPLPPISTFPVSWWSSPPVHSSVSLPQNQPHYAWAFCFSLHLLPTAELWQAHTFSAGIPSPIENHTQPWGNGHNYCSERGIYPKRKPLLQTQGST